MFDSDNENNGDKLKDTFWDLDFARPKREGPFTDGRHSTEAVGIDNSIGSGSESRASSFLKVMSTLPPAVEITQTGNPLKNEKKKSTRVYSDMDAERRLIRDALEASRESAVSGGGSMGLKTGKINPNSVPKLDVPSIDVPNIVTAAMTITSKDTEIPKRPENWDSAGEKKSSAGDYFELPRVNPVKATPYFSTQKPQIHINDNIIPNYAEGDPNMPPLEPPPENFNQNFPYIKPERIPERTENPHTNKFNQSFNRSGTETGKTAEQRHKPSLLLEYAPEKSLIRKVSVYKWPSNYNFYENFCSDAAKLFARKGTECPMAEFFSYVPQYNQLKRVQLEYYLWWRENFRKKIYLEADFSYILLYIYEIINLPDLIPPEEGIECLCRVWSEYRAKYIRLDKYLIEWICDYCLIYRLPCPAELLKHIIPSIAEKAALKEFYISVFGDANENASENSGVNPPVEALISFVSNYNWQSSKFAQDTESEAYLAFGEHIPRALDYVQRKCREDGADLILDESANLRLSKISRDAFCGSLCAYNIKRRIDIEVLSFSRSHEFREQITNIVKYSENRIRAYVKIKSRLGVGELPPHILRYLDEYFSKNLPMQRKNLKNQPKDNEYDKFYDAPRSTLTAESAGLIEQASWGTTELLMRAFTDDDAGNGDGSEEILNQAGTEYCDDDSSEDYDEAGESGYIDGEISYDSGSGEDETTGQDWYFTETQRKALRAAAEGTFSLFCRDAGLFPETVSSEINDIAITLLGDIVLEESENGFTIIGDYADDVYKWYNT